MATEVNFLSLPREMQHMIYTKMENLEVMKMSATCNDASFFLQNHKKALYSRIHTAESVILQACKEGIYMRKEKWTGNSVGKYLRVDSPDFYKNIGPFAIKDLAIEVRHNSKIFRLVEILKKWQPHCLAGSICGNLPSEALIRMDDCIRYSYKFMLDCRRREEGEQVFSNLKTLRNPGLHILILPEYARYGNLLEKTRSFGAFRLGCSAPEIVNFLCDLDSSKNAGNLKRACFITPVGRSESLRYSILLLVHGMPQTAVLFKTCDQETLASGARTVLKLSLKNEFCAVIVESNSSKPLAKFVDVIMTKDEDEAVYNILTTFLEIDEGYFSEYYKKNDEQRLEYLQTAYRLSMEKRERVRNRINLYIGPSYYF